MEHAEKASSDAKLDKSRINEAVYAYTKYTKHTSRLHE